MNELKYGHEVDSVIIAAQASLREIIENPINPKPEKKGGYLTIINGTNGDVILIYKIGQVPLEKRDEYFNLSLEKAKRLCKNIFLNSSSWESRNPDNNKWGGAIKCGEHYGDKKFIISFSGLTEHADEALIINTAIKVKWLYRDQGKRLAKISNNIFFH